MISSSVSTLDVDERRNRPPSSGMSFRNGTPASPPEVLREIKPPSSTVEPSRSDSLVSILRVLMVGDDATPVSVLAGTLTSCATSRSSRLPELMTGRTRRIMPVLRYCTVWIRFCCAGVKKPPLLLPVDCWLVMIGTSSPTWMVADSPLRVMIFGLDRMRASLLLASADKRPSSVRALLMVVKFKPLPPKVPKSDPVRPPLREAVQSMPRSREALRVNSATTTSIKAERVGRSSSRSSTVSCWYSSAVVLRTISVLVALLTTTRPLLAAPRPPAADGEAVNGLPPPPAAGVGAAAAAAAPPPNTSPMVRARSCASAYLTA